jgi:molybdate transport system substrate-binding protein
MHVRPLRRLAARCGLVASLVGTAACGDDGSATGAADPAGTGDATATGEGASDLEGTVTVFAAASLTDAFDEMVAAFEEANPAVTVEANYGASSGLREQILAGAPADVFASANLSNMDQVVEAGAVEGEPETFARNVLEIVVPAGNPAEVTGLADFRDDDLLVGLCAAQVPCGQFGREALAKAGVTPAIDTDEPDVRSLLTKVQSGDLDAGIVYRTDVLAAGDAVEGIAIPDDDNVVADYPIAALADAGNPRAAEAFVELVVSDEGQEILQSYGFEAA